MATPLNPKTVNQLITGDIEACKALIALLEREQQALKERNPDELGVILEEKIPHLNLLEQSAQARTQWSQCTTPEEASAAWLSMLDELNNSDIKERWQELKDLLKQCQVKNEVNSKMLTRNQKVFGRLLDIMRGQSSSNKLYNATGITSGPARSQIVGKA